MPFIISLFVRIHFPVRRPHGRADILFAADDMHAGGESQPFNRGGPVMNLLPLCRGCFLIHSLCDDHKFIAAGPVHFTVREHFAQDCRRFLQDPVSRAVALLVVDALQPVQITEKQ